MSTHPAAYDLMPELKAHIEAVEREHTEWLGRLSAHFDKMVAASMNNRHPDEKRELMRDFIKGLESHFDTKYSRR